MKKNTARRAVALALAAGLALQPLAYVTAYAGEAVSEESAVTEASPAVVMERLYNKWTGEHLYTSSKAEVSDLTGRGWKDEGTAWYAPATSSTPVYRLYNPYSSDHHYTTSKDEYDACAKAGWRKEGVAWYSADSKSVPLYRGFNPYEKVGTHHYTTSSSEMSQMAKNGWRKEGVAWYGLKWVEDKAACDSQEWVVDTPAWDEPVYEKQVQFVCKGCKQTFPSEDKWSIHNIEDHPGDNPTYYSTSIYIQTGTTHHDEVGHWETVHHGAEGHWE